MSKIKNLSFLIVCFLAYLYRGKANKVHSRPQKIAILRWKPHMGDVVYITPMFGAVKAKYPESKLYVIGAGRVEEVIRHNPDIDEYINYENNFWETIRRLKKEKIDFACLANTGNTESLALLYLAGIKCISAFASVNDKPIPSFSYSFLAKKIIGSSFYTGRYVPPQYLKLLEPINANTGDAHFRLYFSNEAEDRINNIFIKNNILADDFIVAFASGGAIPERWWPAERFAELALSLHKEHDAKILIVGAGKDEKPITAMIAALGGVPAVNLLNQNLDEFKATISKCDLVVGNDSGPMVTADAFDVANLVFVGPTDEREYHRPPGPLNRVLKGAGGDVGDIMLDMAKKEIDVILNNLNKKNSIKTKTMNAQIKILIPVSSAELIDKIAILEVKSEKIKDPEKLKHVRHELETLREIFDKHIQPTEELNRLFDKLRQLSAKGWDIEDKKRLCEKNGDFGSEFIEAARGAFKNNDERAAVWREINLLLKSDIVQEKSYEKY